MPPKKQQPKKAVAAPAVESKSRDLITLGPRDVVHKKTSVKRDENGKRPSTSRALVLRNGKYGAMGEQQIALLGKLSGREKLDLLAEDLMQNSKTAMVQAFKSGVAIKICSSQFDARLDDIVALKDSEFFYDNIRSEAEARTVPRVVKGNKVRSAIADTDNVVAVTSTSIHNTYMLASAWKMAMEAIKEIDVNAKYPDSQIRKQLAEDVDFRERYLVVWDIINVLVDAGHSLFQVLVTTTKHYAQFFKLIPGSRDPRNPEYQFQFERLQDVHKSFLDSIIIELCLPGSPIPKPILFQLLHDAVDEAPREAHRFPQALWDAVGDLSVMTKLQTMLETPLHGPEGEDWKANTKRTMPEVFDKWTDAQLFSTRAMETTDNWTSAVNPLERSRKQDILDKMWELIDENYEAASGQKLDDLWGLTGCFERKPRWAPYRPKLDFSDSEDDNDAVPGLAPVRRRGGNKKDPLQITTGDDESDASMPSLRSISDSSADTSEAEEEAEEESEYEDEDEDDEYEYDSDDEENFKDMLRDAMNTATGIPGIFDPKVPKDELEALPEDKKDNPFLKLLGSLRGRMFSGNPKLKTTGKDAPRGGYKTSPPPVKKPAAPEPAKAPKQQEKAPEGPESRKPTVEDVEDEDSAAAGKKKKKKKPKKKKAAGGEAQGLDAVDEEEDDERPATPPPMSPDPDAPGTPENAAAAAAKKKKKKKAGGGGGTAPPAASASQTTLNAPSFTSSTATLPTEQKAMGGKAYLAQEGVQEKQKEKTRGIPAQAPLFPDKKESFLSKFGIGKKKELTPQEQEEETQKRNWFSRLSKRTTVYIHQLLATAEDEKKGKASMKWDNFVKVMKDMGFSYDPTTAGSSVRFDHPNARSITFHKPHPDPTVTPVMLKKFSKKLKDYYGWSEEDFYSKIH